MSQIELHVEQEIIMSKYIKYGHIIHDLAEMIAREGYAYYGWLIPHRSLI